ncbi:MAG: MMPL family transporter [Miltoncostaeaceae bacterium]
MASLLHRMARWVAHNPIKGLLLWVLIVVGLTVVVSLGGARTTNDTSLPGTQSQDATNVLAAAFPPTENGTSPIVFKVKSGTVNSTANKNAITASVNAIAKVPHVTQATSPYGNAAQYLQSKSGTIAYVPVLMNVSSASITEKQAQAVLDAAEPARKAGMQVAAGGTVGATLSNPNTDMSTVIGLIAAVIILAVSFGSLIAMFIPIISAIVGLALGLAVIGLLGHLVSVPSIAPTLATMIGLGVGIDYALFVVSRHREQLARGMDPKESVALAVGTAGTAVVFAGGTLVVALIALAVAGIPLISSLGYASSLAVVTAVLAATLLLPAILSLLGHKLNSLPIFHRRKGSTAAGAAGAPAAPSTLTGGVWARWGGFVTRHPWWMLIVGLAILVPMAIPVWRMNLGQEDVGVSSLKTTQRQAYDFMTEGFGVGYNGPLLVAVQLNPPAQEDPTVAAQQSQAEALQAQLEQEQAQGQAEEARLQVEAARVKAEAAVLTAQRQDLDAQAAALSAKRKKLTAQAQALRRQARGDAEARAAALVAMAKAEATAARAAAARYRSIVAEVREVQADIAAIEAEIAATVDPAVLARLQERKANLDARVAALLAQADLQEKAAAAASAREAELRAQARAVLTAPLTPEQQSLVAQARSIVAQAESLAAQRATLLRKREALVREEARLLAQVASLEAQKAQLLALQVKANQQLAEANQLKAEVTAALTAAGGNPLGTDPRLVTLQNALKATAGVQGVSVPSVNESGTAAYYSAIPTTAPASDTTVALVKRVRDSVVPSVEKESKGLTAYVGGTTASNIDLAQEITDALPLVILTVALLNMFVLLLAFRSIFVPIQAAVVITLIALATFGLLTLLFQLGFGFSLVGLDPSNVCCTVDGRPSDPIASYVPLMMYAAIFGLANDYQVFLLSRVRADGVKVSPAAAVADGVRTASRVIATAALIMLSVFAAFIINGDPVIKQFGVGLSAGVLLAGGLTLFMVPAILRLLGRGMYWIPHWLDRILPNVDIEGEKLVEKVEATDAPSEAPDAPR